MHKAHRRDVLRPVGRWGEREQGILQVATQLYVRGGYENVSMATVASAAGLSEGTLYNYFRDKQDLVLRVSLAAFESHTAEAEKIVDASTSLRQGLEGLIALELDILIEAKELFRIWLREVRGASGYPQSAARKALRRFSAQLIRLFEKWDAAPDSRLGLSLPLMRDIFFGSLEHVVWTALVQRREDAIDVPRISRDLASAYLRAFGLDDGQPPARRRAGKSGAEPAKRNRKSANGRKANSGTRHASSSS
jgi:TetR/AcrR family transcriptional regulator, fatty acid metabolism regulator protein